MWAARTLAAMAAMAVLAQAIVTMSATKLRAKARLAVKAQLVTTTAGLLHHLAAVLAQLCLEGGSHAIEVAAQLLELLVGE